MASLVSDDLIASEHFADELKELRRLRDEAENAQADLMAYAVSVERRLMTMIPTMALKKKNRRNRPSRMSKTTSRALGRMRQKHR